MKQHLGILFLLSISLLFTACSRKPYSYPNYDIIKPSKTCKPNRKNIKRLLNQYLNKPYIWAEEGPNAFDCSGLTYNIYGKMGINIPRVAREQAKVGKSVNYNNLIYGDLIFFGSQNGQSRRITHVGIYLGDGWFAHASSRDRKVIYTNFDKEPIYLKRMKICKRYMSKSEKEFYMTCSGKLTPMKTTTTLHTTPWKPGNRIPRRAVP
ncbi:MAG: C40 family peptidase [Campylobacterota bacterium]|nr:C40 family peptidase [Campylobacterota bacterium]